MREPTARAAIGATLLAAVLWGTSFSVNDYGLAFVGPATFAALRFALAGGVFLGVLALAGRLDTRVPRMPLFWGLAVANALGFLLQYEGQTLTTPARTALFVNTSAFAVAILERFAFGLRIGPRRGLAILVGVAGAALLVTRGDPRSLEGGQLVGDLLALLGGLAWSVYFVYNRPALGRSDVWNVLGWTFLLTALLLLPATLLDTAPLVVQPQAWAPIVWAGIMTTAGAYGLWAWGLKRIRATTSAVLLLVEILVAALVSVALGRETFGAWDFAGAALLVAAVVAMSLLAPEDEKATPA